ncbi:MAG: hypothetical protein LBO05_07375 [Deltaproteobacteria bacterium]|nr:hypothetical protein [Deltaproteobacteria bacterium]
MMELKFDVGKSIPPQTRIVAGLSITALAAIDKKKYAQPYEGRAREVIKIGLGIYGRARSLALMGSGE